MLHISFRLIVRYVNLFYIYYTNLKVGEIFARIENIEAPNKCKMNSCKIARTYHAQHYQWIKIPPKFHSEERINDKRWIKKQREHVRKTLKGIKERSRKRGNGLEMLDDKDEQGKEGQDLSLLTVHSIHRTMPGDGKYRPATRRIPWKIIYLNAHSASQEYN